MNKSTIITWTAQSRSFIIIHWRHLEQMIMQWFSINWRQLKIQLTIIRLFQMQNIWIIKKWHNRFITITTVWVNIKSSIWSQQHHTITIIFNNVTFSFNGEIRWIIFWIQNRSRVVKINRIIRDDSELIIITTRESYNFIKTIRIFNMNIINRESNSCINCKNEIFIRSKNEKRLIFPRFNYSRNVIK